MDDWVLGNRPERWPFAVAVRLSEQLLFAVEDLGKQIESAELRQYAAELAWSVLIRAQVPRPPVTVDDLKQLLDREPPAPIEADPIPNFEI